MADAAPPDPPGAPGPFQVLARALPGGLLGELGHPRAHLQLAYDHSVGSGVERDLDRAAQLYRRVPALTEDDALRREARDGLRLVLQASPDLAVPGDPPPAPSHWGRAGLTHPD